MGGQWGWGKRATKYGEKSKWVKLVKKRSYDDVI
jgi:hypothetical protein